MGEAPFEMPGHRWDPDKKRFFKIASGPQSKAASASHSSGAGPTLSTTNSTQKGKQRQAVSAEEHFAFTPRLPAIDVRTPAQKLYNIQSAFQEAILDPVTLRQHARMSVTDRQVSEQVRTEATYSHLALCTAQSPFYPHQRPSNVLDLQTDTDGRSLIVADSNVVVRIIPNKDVSDPLYGTRRQQESPFIWTSSQRIWYGAFEADGTQTGIISIHSPKSDLAEANHRSQISGQRSSSAIADAVTFLDHEQPERRHGQDCWAFAEIFRAPRDVEMTSSEDSALSTNQPGFVSYALATGNVVSIRGYKPDILSRRIDLVYDIALPAQSDVMALTFDLDGHVLYCGTRSGKILAWPYFAQMAGSIPIVPPIAIPFEAEGSVTNIAIVSATELLVVRINGSIQLVDIATGEVKQRYLGHVNSYRYKLAFAVDKESRLLALAGIDSRVRVWSLDSPLPLGTSTTTLTPALHPCQSHSEGQGPENWKLYDESEDQAFLDAHRGSEGNPGIRKGSTLSTIVFPRHPNVLHWHPRYPYEGLDPHEVQAVREAQGSDYRPPQSQWKDLFVGADEWLYQFRFF